MGDIIDASSSVPVSVPEPEPEPELELEPAHPDPSAIPHETWMRCESAALGMFYKIQPSVTSEHFRAAVIDYLQRLFGSRGGFLVFPFGSVPLKTYLPDGDIDLTAFGPTISNENLANEVCAILKSEEHREDSEFDVKDVQYINAQVKLVKCIVQNIVVDISVNQIGGLCTLCFLEKVDEKFGKKHLLKRSIVLIKNLCYYESRILGAHHGLLSTYALEILVLYVFHIFHRSLNGPLAVLYRFLDFYSKFDWDSKGISLSGPVSLSSLPDLVTDPHSPAIHDHFFLPREKFLRECAEAFSAPPRNSERGAQVFPRKFLNIIDPLKQNNNLGRSVSKGNFYRIRSAFDFGAHKLGKILQMPFSHTVNEMNQFFSNTLKRNHTGFRPDVLVSSYDDGILTYHAMSLGFLDRRRVNNASPLYSNPCGDLSYQFNNILKDLTGDFETNFHNLQYAQRFQQVNPANPFYSGRLAPPPLQYQNTRPSDGQGRKNPHAYASMNGAVLCPPYPSGYVVRRPFIQPDDPIAMRACGIGTYFPDPRLCKDRPPARLGESGRNQFTSNTYQRFHHHVRTDMPADMGSGQEFRHELQQIHIPGAADHGMPSPSPNSTRDQLKVPAHSPSSQLRRHNFHGNGFMLPQDIKLESSAFDSKLESGILGALPLEVTSKDHASRSESASSNQFSGPDCSIISPQGQRRLPTTIQLNVDGDTLYELRGNRERRTDH